MRILWFSITQSLFNPHSNSYNGGGWVASLEKIVHSESSIELGVAFVMNDHQFKYERDGVCYYPIVPDKPSFWDIFNRHKQEKAFVDSCLRVIDDFKPDIIQIFGSENSFGLLCQYTKIPIVIHIQGCMPPYHNALFPVGMNQYDFLFTGGLSLKRRFVGLRSEPAFLHSANREIEVIKSCRYFMGRTEWDKNLISLFNPAAHYFHVEEALRSSFMNSHSKWRWKDQGKVTISSTISNPWYKGIDLILKTAKLLSQHTCLDFEWNVFGVMDISFFEHKYGIKASDVHVNVCGVASKEQLTTALLESSCYVHPSYIENSPNSLCEAQLMGLPVIATFVGGIPSLVDGNAGWLVPANDPYTTAAYIKQLCQNKDLASDLGNQAHLKAIERHSPENIKKQLLHCYHSILQYESTNN